MSGLCLQLSQEINMASIAVPPTSATAGSMRVVEVVNLFAPVSHIMSRVLAGDHRKPLEIKGSGLQHRRNKQRHLSHLTH